MGKVRPDEFVLFDTRANRKKNKAGAQRVTANSMTAEFVAVVDLAFDLDMTKVVETVSVDLGTHYEDSSTPGRALLGRRSRTPISPEL